MEDFPNNSRAPRVDEVKPAKDAKTADKKIERVIEGEIIRRKKPLSKKFKEMFVGGDAKSVWGYVVLDVLVPAAKDMVADAVTQGVERTIFGEARSSSRRGRSRNGSNGHVNYSKFSSSNRPPWESEPRRELSRRSRSSHDFDEIIIPTRGEAEEVIDRLLDIISAYDQATVSDLYDLVGAAGNFTDEKWGWTDLRGADVRRIREGYLLQLPRPEPLD